MDKLLLIALVIVLALAIFYFVLYLITVCWDYITDHLVPGMVEQGLVADQIDLADALVLFVFATLLGVGIGLGAKS